MSKLTNAEKLRLAKIFANSYNENIVLRDVLKRLVFAARTTGGTAGRDDGLCAICDEAEAALLVIPQPAPSA